MLQAGQQLPEQQAVVLVEAAPVRAARTRVLASNPSMMCMTAGAVVVAELLEVGEAFAE